jgi:hypothetical protein
MLAERRAKLSRIPQALRQSKAKELLNEVLLSLEIARGELTSIARQLKYSEGGVPDMAAALLCIARIDQQLKEVALLAGYPDLKESIDSRLFLPSFRARLECLEVAQRSLERLQDIHHELASRALQVDHRLFL